MKWLSDGYHLEMAYIRSARKPERDNVTNHVRDRGGEESQDKENMTQREAFYQVGKTVFCRKPGSQTQGETGWLGWHSIDPWFSTYLKLQPCDTVVVILNHKSIRVANS